MVDPRASVSGSLSAPLGLKEQGEHLRSMGDTCPDEGWGCEQNGFGREGVNGIRGPALLSSNPRPRPGSPTARTQPEATGRWAHWKCSRRWPPGAPSRDEKSRECTWGGRRESPDPMGTCLWGIHDNLFTFNKL